MPYMPQGRSPQHHAINNHGTNSDENYMPELLIPNFTLGITFLKRYVTALARCKGGGWHRGVGHPMLARRGNKEAGDQQHHCIIASRHS